MKLSADKIQDLQRSGAKIKRISRPETKAPKEKEVVEIPQTPVPAAVAPKIPDYGDEIKALITVLDNRLQNPRLPWRINVNRSSSGFAESYDVIPLNVTSETNSKIR